jgi:hypothetical protein
VKKDSDWVVGTDEVGQAVLKWKVGGDGGVETEPESGPLDRTYDFLRRLEVDGLSLEKDEAPARAYDPYNSGEYDVRGFRRKP